MTASDRRFIKAYLDNGGNALAAYKVAFPDRQGSDENLGASAVRVRDKPWVQAEIKRALGSESVPVFLTLADKRQFMRDLVTQDVRTALAQKPHLVQRLKVRERVMEDGTVERTTEITLPDKLRAVELDAKLAGELRERVELGPIGPMDAALDSLLGLASPTLSLSSSDPQTDLESLL